MERRRRNVFISFFPSSPCHTLFTRLPAARRVRHSIRCDGQRSCVPLMETCSLDRVPFDFTTITNGHNDNNSNNGKRSKRNEHRENAPGRRVIKALVTTFKREQKRRFTRQTFGISDVFYYFRVIRKTSARRINVKTPGETAAYTTDTECYMMAVVGRRRQIGTNLFTRHCVTPGPKGRAIGKIFKRPNFDGNSFGCEYR